MDFWKGAFSPHLVKTVYSTEFMSIEDMTEEDWDWLDYEELRNVAQNRIAEIAADDDGGLAGFAVIITSGGKGKYLWPVPIGDGTEDNQDNNTPLVNAPDHQDESDTAKRIRLLIFRVRVLPRIMLRAIASVIDFQAQQNSKAPYSEKFDAWGDAKFPALVINFLLYHSLADTEEAIDEFADMETDQQVATWIKKWSAERSQQIAAGRGLT